MPNRLVYSILRGRSITDAVPLDIETTIALKEFFPELGDYFDAVVEQCKEVEDLYVQLEKESF